MGLLERRRGHPRPSCTAPTSTRSASATASCTRSCARSTSRRATAIPIALKDVISTEGVETTAGSRILEGYVPVFDATVDRALQGARACRCSARRTRTSSRWARRPRTRPTARRATRGTRRACPGGSGGGSAAAVSAGLAPWALGSDTGGSIKQPAALTRHRRPAPDLRHRLALRRRRVRVEPRPGRPGHAHGARLRAALPHHRRPRPAPTRPPSSCRRRSRSRRPRTCAALRVGVPRELNEAEGIEPGVKAAVERGDRPLPRARRRGGGVRAAALGRVRAALLLPDRARGGVVEPRALRRRPLRPARRRRRATASWSTRTRDERLRRRAEAPHHARHVRALGRLLRRVLRPGAEGADA